MKVLAVGAKVILYFAFVRTLVVLCDSGDDIAETDSFAFWSTNVLLFYRAAETLWKRTHSQNNFYKVGDFVTNSYGESYYRAAEIL